MATVFAGQPGRVVQLEDAAVPSLVQSLVQVESDPLSFEQQTSVVTKVQASEEVNAQFLHTLGADIYIYVFGDRMSRMTLSGLSFAGDCEQENTDHGVERVLAWYRRNKMSRRQEPLSVILGAHTALTCFLTGMQHNVADTRARLVRFQLSLAVVPEPEDFVELEQPEPEPAS